MIKGNSKTFEKKNNLNIKNNTQRKQEHYVNIMLFMLKT